MRLRDPIDGRDKIMWVDAGFNASPVASHLMDELFLRKARAAMGDAAARRALAEMLSSAPRLRAWRAFVENALAMGRPQNRTMTLGLTPDGAIVYLPDTLIVGPKARRHEFKGEALDHDAWTTLGERFNQARWFEDVQTGNFAALLDDVAVYIDKGGKVDSIYRDPLIKQKIAAKRLVEAKRRRQDSNRTSAPTPSGITAASDNKDST